MTDRIRKTAEQAATELKETLDRIDRRIDEVCDKGLTIDIGGVQIRVTITDPDVERPTLAVQLRTGLVALAIGVLGEDRILEAFAAKAAFATESPKKTGG